MCVYYLGTYILHIVQSTPVRLEYMLRRLKGAVPLALVVGLSCCLQFYIEGRLYAVPTNTDNGHDLRSWISAQSKLMIHTCGQAYAHAHVHVHALILYGHEFTFTFLYYVCMYSGGTYVVHTGMNRTPC